MTKIIKEMLPPDVRVARDTQDLLIECCVGETNVILWLLSNLIFFFFILLALIDYHFFPINTPLGKTFRWKKNHVFEEQMSVVL
jgi:hypothetical protein